MVTQRLHLSNNDHDIEFDINYRVKELGDGPVFRKLNIDTTWYCEYDRYRDCGVFDAAAPIWYIHLATICETACHNPDFASRLGLDITASENPRADAEAFVANKAGKHRQQYIAARMSLYCMFLSRDLYRHRHDEFKQTIKRLCEI